MLEVAGLNAGYGRAHILFDLDLSAAKGEVVVLLDSCFSGAVKPTYRSPKVETAASNPRTTHSSAGAEA